MYLREETLGKCSVVVGCLLELNSLWHRASIFVLCYNLLRCCVEVEVDVSGFIVDGKRTDEI